MQKKSFISRQITGKASTVQKRRLTQQKFKIKTFFIRIVAGKRYRGVPHGFSFSYLHISIPIASKYTHKNGNKTQKKAS